MRVKYKLFDNVPALMLSNVMTENIRGRICSVCDGVFKEGYLDDSDLFLLLYKTVYYVSHRFKERVIKAGFKGFAFHMYFFG